MQAESTEAVPSAAASAVRRILADSSGAGPGRVRLVADHILDELVDLAVRLGRAEIPPLVLHLELRPAQVLGATRALEQAARILDTGPHRLDLGLVEWPGFGPSADSSAAWQTLRALRILRTLSGSRPQSVGLLGDGGLLLDGHRCPADDRARELEEAIGIHFGLDGLAAGAAREPAGAVRVRPSAAETALLDPSDWPACCAEAARGLGPRPAHLRPWILQLRRCQHPGPIRPGLDPFRSISHLPCSFDCPGSSPAHVPDSADHPVLFLLDRERCWLELVPRGAVGRSFAFGAGRRGGDDPRLDLLAAGGEVFIQPGLVTIARSGRHLVSFALTAAVFMVDRVYDVDFWLECVLQRLFPPDLPPRRVERPVEESAPAEASQAPGSGEQGAPPADPASLALCDRLAALPEPEGGLRVGGWEPTGGRQVTARLEHDRLLGGDALLVLIERRAGAGKHFLEAGAWAIGYSEQTPLDSVGRRSVFRQFAAWLKRFD